MKYIVSNYSNEIITHTHTQKKQNNKKQLKKQQKAAEQINVMANRINYRHDVNHFSERRHLLYFLPPPSCMIDNVL